MTELNSTPRGIRNNNPGNIRLGSNWKGLVLTGQNHDKDFCVFTTPEYGIRALGKILINYQCLYGLNSIRKIITRYAPPNENQTSSYINSVASQLGVNPDATINLHDRATLTILIKSIIRIENGQQPYTDETIQKGLDLI